MEAYLPNGQILGFIFQTPSLIGQLLWFDESRKHKKYPDFDQSIKQLFVMI